MLERMSYPRECFLGKRRQSRIKALAKYFHRKRGLAERPRQLRRRLDASTEESSCTAEEASGCRLVDGMLALAMTISKAQTDLRAEPRLARTATASQTGVFLLDASRHTPDSCWVILYGRVYDVTDFLPSHPGGSKIILQLAGRDATEDYDPIHPRGTLESALPASANLGPIDEATIVKPAVATAAVQPNADAADAPLDTLLNLTDFEYAARSKLSEKAWAYYFSGADDLRSKELNQTAYTQILFRPRVFVDVTRCDLSTSLLGIPAASPLYVAPAAMARLGHPSGERGIAIACGRKGILQVVSNNASMTVEEIVDSPVTPAQAWGFQLYVQDQRDKSLAMLRRVEATGRYKFVVLTLDAPVPGKRELDERAKNAGNLTLTSSVGTGTGAVATGGLGKALFVGTAADLTWKDTLPWLRAATKLPIILKGVQTWEDAKLASEHAGVVGVVVSNHGGRGLDTAPPAVYTLLEMRRYCPQVFQKIEVWVDGGIKRGTDVVKGIGRAALFGLSVGGSEGVERVIDILHEEMATCIRLLGARSISELGMHYINARALDPLLWRPEDDILAYRATAKL
ncbi:hypothetical protein Dda_8400 [Drechslerella dactyloides]|uniref:L-lactate dehydrogenase (cytochrome) n=1 Tax=Drechslerella dactyloides TaxID=74499 RepID=A0AAD6NH88_DREDA|nr:hypothetical protein Dda_8400 [Drechslerella dactyloides]